MHCKFTTKKKFPRLRVYPLAPLLQVACRSTLKSLATVLMTPGHFRLRKASLFWISALAPMFVRLLFQVSCAKSTGALALGRRKCSIKLQSQQQRLR